MVEQDRGHRDPTEAVEPAPVAQFDPAATTGTANANSATAIGATASATSAAATVAGATSAAADLPHATADQFG